MTVDDIKRNRDNKEKVNLTGYVPSFDFTTSATGTKSIVGKILADNDEIGFRIWTGNTYDKVKANNLGAGVYEIYATVNVYNGQKTLILDQVDYADNQDVTAYLSSVYNPKEWWKRATDHAGRLTSEGKAVFKEIMQAKDVDEEKANLSCFLKSVAAKSHHDAVIHGLLAHSVKVTDIVVSLVDNYPNIKSKVNMDVLIIGALLHDIGKLIEYEGLGMSEVGKWCSHLSLSVELLATHRDFIAEKLGGEAYYRLQSVVTQHHGEYGDRPRTYEAYLVHKADMLEATLTGLNESIEEDLDEVTVRDGSMMLKLH